MDFGALAVFGFHPKIYLLFTKTDSNNYSRRLKVCTEYTACMHAWQQLQPQAQGLHRVHCIHVDASLVAFGWL